MIDWSVPIEPVPPSVYALVAGKRVETSKMTWVQIVDGEVGWDGWYAKDDGTPMFDTYRPRVRNIQDGDFPFFLIDAQNELVHK